MEDAIIEQPLKIGMINLCGSLGTKLNLEKLFELFPIDNTFVGIKFNEKTKGNVHNKKVKKQGTKSFYNCLTIILKLKERFVKPKIFCSGSVHIPGCKNTDEGPLILQMILNKFFSDIPDSTFKKNIGDSDEFDPEIRIEDTMYTIQYKVKISSINRTKIAALIRQKYKVFALYRPQRYPGVRVYYYSNDTTGPVKRRKVTIIIQNSGIISIKGANTVDKYIEAYHFINKIIEENKDEISF